PMPPATSHASHGSLIWKNRLGRYAIVPRAMLPKRVTTIASKRSQRVREDESPSAFPESPMKTSPSEPHTITRAGRSARDSTQDAAGAFRIPDQGSANCQNHAGRASATSVSATAAAVQTPSSVFQIVRDVNERHADGSRTRAAAPSPQARTRVVQKAG